MNSLVDNRLIFEHPLDLAAARARFPEDNFAYLTKKSSYPDIIGVEYKGNGFPLKKYWHDAGRSNYVWTTGDDLPKDMQLYIQNLDLVNVKCDEEVPNGMRKRVAAIATKYRLDIDLLDKIALKEGRGHASYNRRINCMKVVPEYFLRFGVIRIGPSFIDEFEKTFIHEFGHAVWHQLLNPQQQQAYIDVIPMFTELDVVGEEDQWGRGVGIAIDGTERIGELRTRKDAPFVSPYARYNEKEDFAESFVHRAIAPELFAKNFPKRDKALNAVLEADFRILPSEHNKVEEDGKKLLLAPVVSIQLQNTDKRKDLAGRLMNALDTHLPEQGLDRQNIKTVVLHGEYTTPEPNPNMIRAVVWVEGLEHPVHIDEQEVDIYLYGDQRDADKKSFELRDLEQAAKQRPPAKEVLDVSKESNITDRSGSVKGGDANEKGSINNGPARNVVQGEVGEGGKEGGASEEKVERQKHRERTQVGRSIPSVNKVQKRRRRPKTTQRTEQSANDLPPGHVAAEVEHGPSLTLTKPLKTRFVEQWHRGTKVKHTDFRILVGGKAYSWALPTGLPKRGTKKLAVLQPPHSIEHMQFEGNIKSGYGKGKVKTREAGQVEVTKWLPNKKSFSIFSGRNRGHYTMVPWKEDNWIVIGHKRRKQPPEVMYKPRDYRMRFKPSMLKDKEYVVVPHERGVRALLYTDPRENRLLTKYRKRGSGFVERTDNFPQLRDVRLKPGMVLDGTVKMKTEGLANRTMLSLPDRAREIQASKGAAVFTVNDILQHDGKDVRQLPYYSRRRILRSVLKRGKGGVRVAPMYTRNKERRIKRHGGGYVFDLNAPYDNVGGRLLQPKSIKKGSPTPGGDFLTPNPKPHGSSPGPTINKGEGAGEQILSRGNEPHRRKLVHRQYSPALARLKFRNSMWTDPNYVIQPKTDGSRYLIYTKGYEGGTENRVLSRKVSVKKGVGHVERTDNVPHLRGHDFKAKDSIIDGEVIRTNFDTTRRIMGSGPENAVRLQQTYGPIHFAAFDILRFKGKDVQGLPYAQRLRLLKRLALGRHASIVPSVIQNKKKFYKSLVKQGWEGVVFKDTRGKYGDKFMSKKKKIETGEYLITGATRGRGKAAIGVGALRLARWDIKDGRWVPAGKVGTGLSDKQRRWFKRNLPKLKNKAVAEIKMMGTYKSGTPRAPVFSRLREDKGPGELQKGMGEALIIHSVSIRPGVNNKESRDRVKKLRDQVAQLEGLPKRMYVDVYGSKSRKYQRVLAEVGRDDDKKVRAFMETFDANVNGKQGRIYHVVTNNPGIKPLLHEFGHVRYRQLRNKKATKERLTKKYPKTAEVLRRSEEYPNRLIGEELYAYDYARKQARKLGLKYKIADLAQGIVGRFGTSGARLAWNVFG